MNTAFHSFSAFIHMGHNGEYVWTAYSIVFIVLVFFLWISARKNKYEKQS